MTDKVEIQGKTVDEAVSEALLRMGARRDEVDVTVLEEPKNGLFGFLGGRPARVIVRRRAGGARRGRAGDFRVDSADHPAHELGSGDGKGGIGRRGGRGGQGGRGGARSENRSENRGENRSENRGENRSENRGEKRGEARADGRGDRRGRRDDSRRDDSKREDGKRDESRRGGRPPRQPQGGEVRAAAGEAPRSDDNQNDQRDGSRRRRGRRGGRGRTGGGREGRPSPAANNTAAPLDLDQDRSLQTIAADQAEFHARIQAAEQQVGGVPGPQAGSEPPSPAEDAGERGESRSRGRRGGRTRGGRGRRGDEERGETRPAAETADTNAEPVQPAAVEQETGPVGGQDAVQAPPAAATVHSQADEAIATGIKAGVYAQPKRGLAEDAIDAGLTELAAGMLVRAGFPCRCEVRPGEYRLVKIVTDDISAGMLIGRHGQTIDAVEHLVERMASAAVGDRVRMNLDINNYRRRREDSLMGYVDQMVAELRASGQDVHLEPMEARERRIVHLEVAGHKGLRTWTEGGPGGRHVVIGIDDGTPRQDDTDAAEVGQDDDGYDSSDGYEAAPADTAADDSAPATDDTAAEPERPGADA